jgi:hypothetical protein
MSLNFEETLSQGLRDSLAKDPIKRVRAAIYDQVVSANPGTSAIVKNA